jgi:hypothetical protein
MNSHFERQRPSLAIGVFLLLLTSAFELLADEFRPALLELNESDGGWVDLTWKVPMRGDQVLALTPVLPEFFEQMGPGSTRQVSGALLETRSYQTGQHTLNGVTLIIDGLSTIPIDVLLRVKLSDGTEHSAILRSGFNSFTIPEHVTRVDLAIAEDGHCIYAGAQPHPGVCNSWSALYSAAAHRSADFTQHSLTGGGSGAKKSRPVHPVGTIPLACRFHLRPGTRTWLCGGTIGDRHTSRRGSAGAADV